MTGHEHYREAERLLANVEGVKADEVPEDQQHDAVLAIQVTLAKAQVHATLALAAATAADQATAYDGDETHARSRGWAGVA